MVPLGCIYFSIEKASLFNFKNWSNGTLAGWSWCSGTSYKYLCYLVHCDEDLNACRVVDIDSWVNSLFSHQMFLTAKSSFHHIVRLEMVIWAGCRNLLNSLHEYMSMASAYLPIFIALCRNIDQSVRNDFQHVREWCVCRPQNSWTKLRQWESL